MNTSKFASLAVLVASAYASYLSCDKKPIAQGAVGNCLPFDFYMVANALSPIDGVEYKLQTDLNGAVQALQTEEIFRYQLIGGNLTIAGKEGQFYLHATHGTPYNSLKYGNPLENNRPVDVRWQFDYTNIDGISYLNSEFIAKNTEEGIYMYQGGTALILQDAAFKDTRVQLLKIEV